MTPALNGQPTPEYRITLDGVDVSSQLKNRLISFTLTDNRGFEADELQLELDDSDGLLALPKRGVQLSVSLGWQGEGVLLQNRFVVDELEHSGTPDVLSIRARSADFRDTLNVKREQSYHDVTLGAIVQTIAARHTLEATVSGELSGIAIEHADQTNESDASFLTRLAQRYGAIACVKNNKLLLMPTGAGKSASGQPLPVVTITRADGDSHRFSIADREAYTGVTAYWLDTRKAKKRASKVNREQGDNVESGVMVGKEGNIKVLRHTYASKQNAWRAAKSALMQLQRGAATFSLSLARGRPDLFSELPVQVKGFKAEIDSTAWVITRCVHSLDSNSAYITTVECELKLTE
ncbi:phage late control D family protein [Edwardsiella ictaluri]|uniref:Phage late control gene D protein (GPD) n=2 Tax=Edwardsiella ictaluri TaxID=67780 RepID=C5BEQ4_EDWI9|nr:phage late control D family protein [Edwardsiella ictaluri]ACR70292.1 Phage late control gene D protein (GPD) [Edwardsiella ictaluri 93-146]AVZ82842.1 phage late control D family protein [Edwardsiella ictaluri]EKS7762492.1 phage late control D family protein [Edwardsiella ictaluri]EKS7770442.1 phage late control D family protein [Edwardsiella ictaluri]EKS7773584.1 phage late control D family protein [Edwardsiella ictaluri]